MPDWRDIRVEGLAVRERIAAVFQISDSLARLPFAQFKVKVLERPDGSFFAIPNVAFRRAGEADWIGGFGNTIDEALKDALFAFFGTLDKRQEFSDSDFCWSDPLDY